MLVKAFGEDEAAKIVRSGTVAVASSETSISRYEPDISSKRAGSVGLKKNYRVSVATVKPEKANDYRVAIAKIRAAQDKAGGGVYTGRRVVEGNRWVFTSAVGFDSGAERDQWPGFQDFMGALYSDREIDQILDAIYGATVESTWFEVAYRPELSHRAPAATSN